MFRAASLTVFVACLILTATADAQAPAWRFHWQPGQVLSYRVEHTMTATDTVDGNKAETVNKLTETKRWQVVSVDATGVALLQLTVPTLRFETKTHKGDVLLFDSANLDKSTPELRDQLLKYVNTPLATLRIDATGKVVEVKECKQGSGSRYESEPPFAVVLPPAVPQPGQSWERAYNVTLEPPQGTGEKLPAVQKYTCKSVDAKGATITLATMLQKLPEAPADRVPLLQLMHEGEIVFDPQAGMLRSARLVVDKEVAGHQGEGSSYHFTSSYVEEYVGAN
jgi:hypothetical protein